MTWEIAGIEAVAEDLQAAGFTVRHRTSVADELAEDGAARNGLLLAELPA